MSQQISDILTLERTQMGAQCSSKKRLIEHVSNFLSEQLEGVDAEDIFAKLIAREKLGSTGIGHGIAIPHTRIRDCQTTIGALFVLKDAIDYDAIDRNSVDLVFVLLVPEQATDDHLNTLSMLAQKLDQSDYRDRLRSAVDSEGLYTAAIGN